MSGYGTHTTPYAKLSNDELNSMYRESTFSKLSDSEKLDLLQESVNRDAAERGMIGAPEVTYADLPAHVGGQTKNGVIQINQELVTQGQTSFQFNGDTIVTPRPDYNCQALNTVIHENIHCWQEQLLDGTITIDDAKLLEEYQANCFTDSAVLQNGSYRLGSHYLNGDKFYHCYYFQSTERDAYKEAEVKTTSIIQALIEKFGTEKSFEEYDKNLQSTGYQKREQEAIDLYKNPNFEKDVNQVLKNQFYGTTVPVDARTESAVKTEMTESYQAQHSLNNAQPSKEEEKTMDNNKDNLKEEETLKSEDLEKETNEMEPLEKEDELTDEEDLAEDDDLNDGEDLDDDDLDF